MLGFAFSLAALARRAVHAITGGGGFSPSLDFPDARNSQYLTLIF